MEMSDNEKLPGGIPASILPSERTRFMSGCGSSPITLLVEMGSQEQSDFVEQLNF